MSMALAMLSKARSQKANAFEAGMTLYLYAVGVKKSVINILNKGGLCSSYTSLMRHISSISKSQHKVIHDVAQQGRFMILYDNINFPLMVREQRFGKKGTYAYATS